MYFIKNVLSIQPGINLIAAELFVSIQTVLVLNLNPAMPDYIFSCSPCNW